MSILIGENRLSNSKYAISVTICRDTHNVIDQNGNVILNKKMASKANVEHGQQAYFGNGYCVLTNYGRKNCLKGFAIKI